MAVTLTGADGLFTILGKVFHAQNTLRTATGTTVATEVNDIITQYENLTLDTDNVSLMEDVASALSSWEGSEGRLHSGLADFAANLIVQMVDDDNELPSRDLDTALIELIRQMEAGGDTVDESSPSMTITPDGSNDSDAVLFGITKHGNGRKCENMVAEDIEGTSSTVQTLTLEGEESSASLLSHDWPTGSGSSQTYAQGSGGVLTNPSFNDETDITDQPDGWIVATGTAGTTIKMSDYEVQTVILSGSPTSGHYLLTYTNEWGDAQTTVPLDWDASESDVQSALRSLVGLSSVDVATTGTSPNLTHTITFTNVHGNVTQLTSTNNLDTGSIAHATTTAGTTNAMDGKSMIWDSDGAELTTIYQKVNLAVETNYAFGVWMATDSFPAAGVITVDLVDGIGGTVINDSEGTANSFTIDVTSGGDLGSVVDTFVHVSGDFRLPKIKPLLVYLRIRISTAISNTSSIYFDKATLAPMTQQYTGGPYFYLFAGKRKVKTSDTWQVVTSNAFAGAIQQNFHRNFNMDDRGLLLPSQGSGSISDGLIA